LFFNKFAKSLGDTNDDDGFLLRLHQNQLPVMSENLLDAHAPANLFAAKDDDYLEPVKVGHEGPLVEELLVERDHVLLAPGLNVHLFPHQTRGVVSVVLNLGGVLGHLARVIVLSERSRAERTKVPNRRDLVII